MHRLLPLLIAFLCASCGGGTPTDAKLTELQRVQSGNIEVVLFAPAEALKQTRNYCTLEFRDAADHHLVDVGMIAVRTTMTMEGQPMDGFVTEAKRIAPGRYTVEMVLAMTGDWTITVDWDGSAGHGSVAFRASVH